MTRYDITIKGWPEATHTVDAISAAQARWKTVRSLRDAGYCKLREWPRGLKVRRIETDRCIQWQEVQP